MQVNPNTNIRLIRSCPLDPTYEHTLWFDTQSQQTEYFKSLPGINFTKLSYQRYGQGVITIMSMVDYIYDCNYMMFQNANYDQRWFYAFITSMEYVNENTARVYYELDVMQTYLFDAVPDICFVEREHSETDNIGDNIVHEDVYFGPYVYEGAISPVNTVQGTEYTMDDMSIILAFNSSFITDALQKWTWLSDYIYPENMYSGVYQGISFACVPATDQHIADIDDIISGTDLLTFGGFLCAFMFPTMYIPISKNSPNRFNTIVPMVLYRNTTFDDYTDIRNNKLFTYPYTCAYLTANRGGGNEFAFEFSDTKDSVVFGTDGNLCTNPSVMAYPIGYKNVDYFYEGAVSIPTYPVCTWGADGVTEWINNNLFKSIAGAAVIGVANASPAAATSTAGKALTQAVPQHYKTLQAIGLARAEFDPGSVHGSAEGDVMFGARNGKKIFAMVKRITGTYARIIDDYFNRYGYATNQMKRPNRNSRPHWNYVKTQNATFKGSVPSDDMKKIQDIYDSGITFWKNGSEVANYTLDNRPV